MTPSILSLDPNLQTITVSLMRHFYMTIINLKVNHIIYIVLPVQTNMVIQMIQDHQLLPLLKLYLFRTIPFLMQNREHNSYHDTSSIVFGLADISTRVHESKYESFTPRHYTTIQST